MLKLKERITSILSSPLQISVIIFIALSVVVGVFSASFINRASGSFYENLLAEAYGTLLDLLIIGIVLLWFNRISEKKKNIKESLSEIDDFRDWHAEEPKYRVLGHLRRLNQYAVFNVPLHYYQLNGLKISRIQLINANMSHIDFRESKLQDASFLKCNLHQASFAKTYCTDVDFTQATLTGSNFEGANLFKCNFRDSSLLMANFKFARLLDVDFTNSDLTGVNFDQCELINCKFSGAQGITDETFEHTKSVISPVNTDLAISLKPNETPFFSGLG